MRDPFRRVVSLRAPSLDYGRQRWIQIVEKTGGVAEADARIDDDNSIHATTRNVRKLKLLLRRELLPRDGPIRVVVNGREVFAGDLTENPVLLQESWTATNDPYLAYAMEVLLELK